MRVLHQITLYPGFTRFLFFLIVWFYTYVLPGKRFGFSQRSIYEQLLRLISPTSYVPNHCEYPARIKYHHHLIQILNIRPVLLPLSPRLALKNSCQLDSDSIIDQFRLVFAANFCNSQSINFKEHTSHHDEKSPLLQM